MKIPSILAERSIGSGSTGPESSPNDFGASTANAVGGLAVAINRGDEAIQRAAYITERKQAIDNADWVSRSISQENDYLIKWLSDENNNTKETVGEDFKALLADREKEYLAAAPNPKAARLFRQQFLQSTEHLRAGAIKTGANVRVSNLESNITNSVTESINAWRTALITPGVDSSKFITDATAAINNTIDQVFGDIAPAKANELRAHLTTQTVLAVVDTSPDLAKKLLASNKTLDERSRTSLMNHIEQATSYKDSANKLLLQQQVADSIKNALHGKFGGKLDESSFTSIYPDAQGKQRYAEYSAQYDALYEADQQFQRLAPMNVEAQTREFNKLAQKANGEAQLMASGVLAQRLADVAKMIKKDPFGYQITYNPSIKAALNRAGKLPNGERDYSEVHALALKYQGYPPKDAKDADMYLNLPSSEHTLLAADTATDTAMSINGNPPSAALNAIDSFIRQFRPEHAYIAFNNLVTLPGEKGLSQAYQLLFLNRNQQFAKSLAGALAGDYSKLTRDDKRDFEAELKSNPIWAVFSRMFNADSNQGYKQVEGFQDAILKYAYSLSFAGKKPGPAVNEATRDLLLSEMGYTRVNGQPMWVMRKTDQTKLPRTDEQVDAIGRGLDKLLYDVPVDKISHGNFPQLDMIKDDKVKSAQLKYALRQNAFWVTDIDGEGATLYYSNGARPFQITTSKGKALGVRFDRLETLMAKRDPAMFVYDEDYPFEIPESIGRSQMPKPRIPKLPQRFIDLAHAQSEWPGLFEERE